MQPSHLPEWNNSINKEKKHPQVAAFRFTWFILDQVQITSVSLHKKGVGVGVGNGVRMRHHLWKASAIQKHSVNTRKQTGSRESCTLLSTLKADLTNLSKVLIKSRTQANFCDTYNNICFPLLMIPFLLTIWMCDWGVSKRRVLVYFLITAPMKSSR